MNVANFHLNLLGRDRKLTPERYWLTERHRELYIGFESGGIRGFASTDSEDDLLGVLVLALFQTNGPEGVKRVLLITPPNKQKWVIEQIKTVAKHIFRCRRGQREGIMVLREAFRQLVVSERPVHAPKSDGWVFFGLSPARLPLWAKGQLLGPS